MKLHSAKNFLPLALTAFFVGCATEAWVIQKNGQVVSEAELNMDKYRCEREAAAAYPYAPESVSIPSGYSSGSSTTCVPVGNTIRCNTSGGATPAPQVLSYDGNSSRRKEFQERCMAALGYQRVQIQTPEASEYVPTTSNYSRPAIRNCETNADCGVGKSCRSSEGGGTECRSTTSFGASPILACKTSADCKQGENCRSKKGGGTECRF